MNFKLTLQYDGTDFHGWQMQGEERTVQGELTRVVTLLEGRSVTVHGSGRTDAGVHAEGQVASVMLEREFSLEKLRAAINGNLSRDARVIKAEVRASAEGFLRYMVRSIAGSLLAVGRGEMKLETIERAIRTGDRSLVAATAPAHGLTLLHVQYD